VGHGSRIDPGGGYQTILEVADVCRDTLDDQKPRKRGRPPKSRTSGGVPESPTGNSSQQVTQGLPAQIRTPQLQSQGLPQQANTTPTRTSPPKPTPTKTVVKALPTVRDHTTDQLNAEGDEYVPREHDEQGERKVSPTGHPLEGRAYKCRTFFVPNRGDKLFMLATECARVLGYRDSYLLFNKNRSLYKIIAQQPEKDDLIQQEILPYSYRSRQIAIVTAKSMFRQFGSRVIANGRRVRDDYWEAKARKQGFTEEDMAGEKRPGAAKARDAAAAEAVNANAAGIGHPDIIYSNVPLEGQPQGLQSGLSGSMPATLAPQLPMIHLAPSDDMRRQDYGNIPRPRQEITGAPYQDRTQASSAAEVLHQASNAADYSRAINAQRIPRGQILSDTWNKKPAAAVSSPQQTLETSPVVSQSIQSPQPHLASGGSMPTGQQPILQHQSSQMMSPQAYSHAHHGNSLTQSPVRGVSQQMRADQMHQRSSGLFYAPGGAGQGSPYNYPQAGHSWGQPPPQPHQSPLSAHQSMSQYSPSGQQQPSHPSQSPHQPPQLHHSGSSGSLHSGMTFQGIPGGLPPSSYSSMGGRSMYQQQPGQSPQQYMQQTTAAQQAGMQGWAPPPQQGQPPGQGWPGY
jgi:hypothetical protein